MNSAVRSWVADIEALTMPSARRVLRRIGGGTRAAHRRVPRHRRADRAESAEASGLLSASQRAARRRPHGTSHLRQHHRKRRCGPHQQLDGARRGAREADAAVPRSHEGAHDVRRPVPHGPARLAVFKGGRRDHRQPLRRAEHAHHDAHRASPRSIIWATPTTSRAACTRSAISARTAASSCTSPKTNAVWSIGSGYGGNALLGKKCLALRLASYQASHEGWLAEHMLIVGCQYKDGPVRYVAGAFPSACGKTNMAMLVPPALDARLENMDGRRRHRLDSSGRRWPAVGGEPRGGIFRRAAGHEPQYEPDGVRHDSARHDFHERRAAAGRHALVGRARRSAAGRSARLAGTAVDARRHPRRRRIRTRASRRPPPTAPRCRPSSKTRAACRSTPSCSARAASTACRSCTNRRDWQHGVFLGATLSSETTAAASGKTGVLRRDPMAMLAFCGYNMGDYFQHWLDMGRQ